MPHMTQGYPFEWKVFDFAQHLSAALAGKDGRETFVILFDGKGSARTLHFECPENSWHDVTTRLDEAGAAYLFYDPFEAPEYTWLSWREVDRSTMERLIGHHFENFDFVKSQDVSSRAPDLEPPGTYPMSWGVMC